MKKRRLVSIITALIMALTVFAIPVFAVEGEGGQEADGALTTLGGLASFDVSVAQEDNVAALTWENVDGAVQYQISLGEEILDTTEETEYTVGIPETITEETQGTVTAIGEDDTVIAEGTCSVAAFEGEKVGDFVAPVLSQVTRSIRQDINNDVVNRDYHTKSMGREYTFVTDKPVFVDWEAVPGAVSYRVYRSQDCGDYTPCAEDITGEVGQYKVLEAVYDTSSKIVQREKAYKYRYMDYKTTTTNPDTGEDVDVYIEAGEYTYYVEALDEDGNVIATSAESETVTVPEFLSSMRTIAWRVKTKCRTKLYKSKSGSSSYKTVAKGTKARIIERKPYRSYVVLYNPATGQYDGQKGYLIRKNIGPDGIKDTTISDTRDVITAAEITSRLYPENRFIDYSDTKKENWINSKGYTSKTNYYIWVSRFTQKLNIFYSPTKGKDRDWKLIRIAECSTGAYLNYTSSGYYTIKSRLAKRNRSTYYYRNLSFYHLTNSIHGPCYLKSNGLLKKSPGHKTSTLGCVRTWQDDAGFVYNKIPKGTAVRTY